MHHFFDFPSNILKGQKRIQMLYSVRLFTNSAIAFLAICPLRLILSYSGFQFDIKLMQFLQCEENGYMKSMARFDDALLRSFENVPSRGDLDEKLLQVIGNP